METIPMLLSLALFGCDAQTRSVAADPELEAEEPEMTMDMAGRSLAPLDEEDDGPLALADVAGAKADHMGKAVELTGAFASIDKGDEAFTVNLTAGEASLACVADAQHGTSFDGLGENDAVIVKGNLAESEDGNLVLQGCVRVEPPPSDEGAKSVPPTEDDDGIMDGAPDAPGDD